MNELKEYTHLLNLMNYDEQPTDFEDISVGSGWKQLILDFLEYTDGVSRSQHLYLKFAETYKPTNGREYGLVDLEGDPLLYVKVVQIKEKFGVLRLYYDCDINPKIDDINFEMFDESDFRRLVDRRRSQIEGFLDAIVTQSGRTCEYTGERGRLYRSTNGWFKTVTAEYAETRNFTLVKTDEG